MADTIEQLVELMAKAAEHKDEICVGHGCESCPYKQYGECGIQIQTEYLIANGVTFATDNNVGHKWIPVTERLPEVGAGKVLCITPSGRYKVLEWLETFGCWQDPGGIDFTNFKRGYVTHWMPLPEPPEGECV